jgi:hypothetical protein
MAEDEPALSTTDLSKSEIFIKHNGIYISESWNVEYKNNVPQWARLRRAAIADNGGAICGVARLGS